MSKADKKIKTVIVDDEQLARTRILQLLESDPEIEIVAECPNGLDAINTINELNPDLVFLDVQMPQFDGFQVLENLNISPLPIVIFVTAYDQYALKAFDVHAVDYLLKPFDDDRFFESIKYAKEKIKDSSVESASAKLTAMIKEINASSNEYLNRLIVKHNGRIYFVKTEDIICIKASGKYLDIFAGDKNHLIRKTMNEIECKLNPDQFIRVHRSAIINVDQIKEIQHWHKNEYVFILTNGEKIKSSSSCRKNLDKVLSM